MAVYRTPIRMPASQSTLSSTATVLGSVGINARTNHRINVTGFWVYYTTAFTVITPRPAIVTVAATLFQLPAITSSTAVTFFQPIVAPEGVAVTVQATNTAAANTVEVGVLYYYDNPES